jgi:glutathione peroxidase
MHFKSMICAALMSLAALPALAGEALLDHDFRPLAGKTPVNLRQTYAGDVLLVVNTASKCGFTPQFEGLEALHAKYGGRGFAVLGFPSGDFKSQEFEDEKQIQQFCTLTYGVKFPMFEKVHVVGKQATPLYLDLAEASGQAPQWNFHKYLIGRDGRLIADYGSKTAPDDPALVAAIEAALQAPDPQAPAPAR